MLKIAGEEYIRPRMLSREEDDIAQIMAWSTWAFFNRDINSCNLFRGVTTRRYIVRLSMQNGERNELGEYYKHLETLCYGDDNSCRAKVIRTYKRNYADSGCVTSVWFDIKPHGKMILRLPADCVVAQRSLATLQ